MKRYAEIKIFVEFQCHQKKKIFESDQYMKSDKMPNIIYAESLNKKNRWMCK